MNVTFNKLAVLQKVQKMAAKVIEHTALELQKAIKLKLNLHNSSLSAGLHSSPPGSPPGKQSGALARSIQAVNDTTDANKPRWIVGTKMKYAKILEFGGPIRPVKSKYLAVPLGEDGYRASRSVSGNIRELNLTLRVTKTGKLFLGKVTRAGFKALFILKRSVYLPARPYFRPAIDEQRYVFQQEFRRRGLVK